MAKLNMAVNNDLDDVKLESNKIDSKKEKKVKDAKKEEKRVKTDKGHESYFSKVRKEMKLVTWPTKKSVVKYSIVTIVMIVLLAVFFIGISALFDLLYTLVQGWIG